MNKVDFLRSFGLKATKEIKDNAKVKQINNYIEKNDIAHSTSSTYINEDKFLYFILNMKSIPNIIEVLNNESYLLNFNYEYKDLAKFFNIYNPKRISMISGARILTDEEYLKYASIEWTQNVFSKSELIIKLHKDKVQFEQNPYSQKDVRYISAFEQNLRTLVEAKKLGILKDVIKRATDVM